MQPQKQMLIYSGFMLKKKNTEQKTHAEERQRNDKCTRIKSGKFFANLINYFFCACSCFENKEDNLLTVVTLC